MEESIEIPFGVYAPKRQHCNDRTIIMILGNAEEKNSSSFRVSTPASMKDKQSQEAIIAGFNAMRNEQRGIAQKSNELQGDLNEHKIVIDTLEGVDGDRKCFRSVW